jgi:hypothetical protein
MTPGVYGVALLVASVLSTPLFIRRVSGGYSIEQSFKLVKLLFAQPREIRQSPLVLNGRQTGMQKWRRRLCHFVPP